MIDCCLVGAGFIGPVHAANPRRGSRGSSVDAVIVCTPPRTHAPIIEAAARAGKAIFCEKPVDLDLGRVERCAEVLRACLRPHFSKKPPVKIIA